MTWSAAGEGYDSWIEPMFSYDLSKGRVPGRSGGCWFEVTNSVLGMTHGKSEMKARRRSSRLGFFLDSLIVGSVPIRASPPPFEVVRVTQIPFGNDKRERQEFGAGSAEGLAKGKRARTEVLALVVLGWRLGGLSEDRPFRFRERFWWFGEADPLRG
jgi:hypothetical protein